MARTRWVALLVAGIVAFAACDSGSTPVASGPSGFDAATAAKKLAARGPTAISGKGGTAKRPDAAIRGIVAADRARLEYPVVTSTRQAQVTVLRDGTTLWFRRTATSGVIGLGPDLLLLHSAGKPAWTKSLTTNQLANALVLPYEPAQLLAEVGKHPISFGPGPAADVGGSRRRGYHAKIPAVEQVAGSTRQRPLAVLLGVSDLTVWTDARGVPLRIAVVTTTSTHSTYDISRATGRIVVDAPAPDQVESADEKLPTAAGAYEPVYSGSAGTIGFTVLRAPSTRGGTCWKVDSKPAYQPVPTPGADGGVCVPPIVGSGSVYDQIGFPLDANAATGYELFALLVPAGTTASMTLADGTTQRPVVVDEKSGLAIFAAPAADIAGLLRVKLPGGSNLYCGPGPVNTPRDLPPEDQQFGAVSRESLRDLPWNCIDTSFVE